MVRYLAFVAIALAVAYLAWRGAIRSIGYDQDLNVGYAAARAWFSGQDPYQASVLRDIMVDLGVGDIAHSGSFAWRLNVYFPPTLLPFLLVAFLPWSVAALVVMGLNLVATAAVAVGVLRLMRWEVTETRALWLLALFIGFAPVHATIAAGQTGLFATALLVGGFLMERSSRHLGAGIAYGVATVLKVQIGLPFVAYLVWRRRWVAAGAALAVIGVTSLIAVGRLELGGVPWLTTWSDNLQTLSAAGGLNDPGPANTERYAMVNLQFLLATFVESTALVEGLTLAIVGALAFLLVWLIPGRRPRRELLALSTVAVLTLVITYHRYYDGVLLVLPIAWAIAALRTRQRRHGIAVLALCATFLLPFQTAFIAFEEGGYVPAWLIESVAWRGFALSLHAWALVVLAAVLLSAAWQGRSWGWPVSRELRPDPDQPAPAPGS